MVAFIVRLPGSGHGARPAVKDLIDIAGVPTTADSQALAAVAGATAGMTLLEPGFAVEVAAATRIGRVRPAGAEADPAATLPWMRRWPAAASR
jgi:hypothetical protein